MNSLTPPPLVSIIIPVYNRNELVVEAVESALFQGYENFEVVISDNCSNDGTWEECIRRYEADPRVVLFRNAENIGPVPNWLAAALAAQGVYVKILFSDDLLLNGCLENLVAEMADDVGFAYSTCLIGQSQDSAVSAYSSPYPLRSDVTRMRSFYGLLLYASAAGSLIPVSPGAALFRRSDVIDSLRRSIHEPASQDCLLTGAGPDVMIFLDSLKRYPAFCHISLPLVYFRSHPGSFSVGDQRKAVQRAYEVTLRTFFSSMPIPYMLTLRLAGLWRLLKSRFNFLALAKRS